MAEGEEKGETWLPLRLLWGVYFIVYLKQLAECMAINSICYDWATFFFCFIKETLFFGIFQLLYDRGKL